MAKFENRHLYIGGSEFASVIEKNPYKKRIELVLEKAQVLANTFDGNEATRRGEKLEEKVIELFEEQTGLLVTDQQKVFKIEENESCMTLLCHVDGLIEENDFTVLFEAKTTDIKSKAWENGIPDYYIAQLEFNMFLAGLDKAYIAVAFCDGDEIVKFDYFPYYCDIPEDDIIEACEQFTADVEHYKKLGVINSGIIKQVDIDSSLIDEYEELEKQIKELKKKLKPLEDKKKLIESRFKDEIGSDYGLEDSLYRITLSNRITSPTNEFKISRSGLKIEYKN
jgi:predicted phage-related endonuclease